MRRTIIDAIKEVMRARDRPLTVAEIHAAIVEAELYTFHSDNPVQIVRNQIRRHCEGLEFATAAPTKHFVHFGNGTYFLLDSMPPQPGLVPATPQTRDMLANLRALHGKYLEAFRRRVLEQIKALDPTTFERFSRNLLEAYGFQEVVVTRASRDGGIDGYGRLKAGLAFLNVAFQCKRWKTATVGRPEVDQFRGAIQGKYEFGLFFTTATFSEEAQRAWRQPGAAPVILIDGSSMVDLMIEKGFGIETEHLPLHVLALDNALSAGEP